MIISLYTDNVEKIKLLKETVIKDLLPRFKGRDIKLSFDYKNVSVSVFLKNNHWVYTMDENNKLILSVDKLLYTFEMLINSMK
jgi:hypothetical protein